MTVPCRTCGAPSTRTIRKYDYCPMHGPRGTCFNCLRPIYKNDHLCHGCARALNRCRTCGEFDNSWISDRCPMCRAKRAESKRRTRARSRAW